MEDKYDRAIAYLTQHPHEIVKAWGEPFHHPAGCLFGYVMQANTRESFELARRSPCGCLTQVKSGYRCAQTYALTKAIRADTRIPKWPQWITVDDLPVFAEWQRKLDKELDRED